MVRLDALRPLHALRRAPLRAPARARGVLLPLAVHRRRPVPRARDLRRARLPAGARRRLVRRRRDRTRWSRRWRAPLDVRCGEAVEAIEHAGGRVTGVRLAGGERIAADVVVSNADVLRTHELRRPPAAAPAAARDDVLLPALPRHGPAVRAAAAPHAARRRRLPRVHPRASPAGASCRARSPPTCTRPRAPSRRWRAPGGDSLAVLLPVPNLRAGIDWDRDGDRLRDALLADLETSFGLDRARATPCVVEHRMTPLDFARELGAVWGNAFAVEPTLHQSAYFRQPNRDRRLAGLYLVGGGTHPGRRRARRAARRRGHGRPRRARPRARRRGAPAVSAGVRRAVAAARPRRSAAPRRSRARRARRRNRVARTFALACRLLPRDAARGRLPALPRLPHARRPRRRAAGPRPRRASRRSRRGRRARPGERTREVAVLDDARRRATAPARRARRLLRGHALGPRAARAFAHRGRARRLLLPRGRDGRDRDGRGAGHARRRARARPAAAALGMAMQRTNILRDIDEDARRGPRLPRPRDVDRFGAPAPGARDGAAARPDRARRRALRRGPRRRRRCCATGARRCAPPAWMYREILRQIERDGYGARAGRAIVRRRRKLWVAARRGVGLGAVTSRPDAGSRVASAGCADAAADVVRAPPARRAGSACCSRSSWRRGRAGALLRRGGAPPAAERRRPRRAAARRRRPELPRRRPRAPARPPRRRLLRRAAGRRARRARHRHARRRRAPARARRPGRTSARGAPCCPALELLAVIANADAGEDGMYRTRQPDAVIRRYLRAARRHGMLLMLDIQPGRSDFFRETTRLERWLREPDVGLALDPEWRVSAGEVPGPGDRARRRARGQRDLGVAGPARGAPRAAGEAVPHPPVHRRHGRRHPAAAPRAGSPWCSTPTASARRPVKKSKYRCVHPRGAGASTSGFKLFYEEDTDLMSPRAGAAAAPVAGRRGVRVGDARLARPLLAALAAAQVAYGRAARPARAGAPRARSSGSCSPPRPPRRCEARGARRGALPVAAAGAIGFAAELAGVATGRPFGHYPTRASSGRASAACRCWPRRRGR